MHQGEILVLLSRASQILQFSSLSPIYLEVIVWSYGGSTAVGLEFINFHKLVPAVCIFLHHDLAHILPPPSLWFDFWSWPWCLAVDLCICFHWLLDDSSMIIVGLFTNLITGSGQVGHPLHTSSSLSLDHP